jgi:hypothetical protein
MLLNEREEKVLEAMKGFDLYGDRPTCNTLDLMDDLGKEFTKDQIKGYLSSLEKKYLIIDCEMPNGSIAWQVL